MDQVDNPLKMHSMDESNTTEHVQIKNEFEDFIQAIQEETTWEHDLSFSETQKTKKEIQNFFQNKEIETIHDKKTNIFENITIKQEENIWEQEPIIPDNQEFKKELNDFLLKEQTNRIHEGRTNLSKNLSIKQVIENLLQEQPQN